VHLDASAIGRQAAQHIIARIEGTSTEPVAIDVGFSIVTRDTT
jgi:DNA-binding LacI/PurR family transcriptional regulator